MKNNLFIDRFWHENCDGELEADLVWWPLEDQSYKGKTKYLRIILIKKTHIFYKVILNFRFCFRVRIETLFLEPGKARRK